MIWLWILVPLLPVLPAVALYRFVFEPSYNEGGMICNAIGAGLMAFALLFPTIRQIEHNVASRSCYSYGANVGREVRYITNSYWDYDCYVRTERGWVTRGKVGEIEVRS